MPKRLQRGFCEELLLILLFVLLFVLTSSYKFDFLIWFVNVPLLLLVYHKPIKRAILLLLAPSILAVAISFTWVAEYNWHAYVLSSAIFSSFLFLFAVIFNVASKKVKGCLRIFIAPFAYSLLIVIYSFSPINSYWADWSMFQNMMAPLIWLVGSNGITFLIILIHSVIAFYIMEKDKKMLITGCMVVLFLLGSYVYSFNADPEGQRIKVALLQGNFNQDWGWRHANSRGIIFDTYENMSVEASKSKPGLIVWPEYAIADEILNNTDLMKRLSNLARKTNAHLVIGTVRFYDGFYGYERLRNDVSLVFASDGKFIGEYSSVKPIPFEKWVLPGNNTNIFYTDIGNFGVSLCYEETQKSVSKSFSSKKAQFLVSLANNQVLDETAGMYLTNLYTNLRAAENGKYLIRATNTGITKIVNPYGKVEAQLPPYARGILIRDIYLNNRITFYAKYGDIILNIFLFILGVLFLKKLLH